MNPILTDSYKLSHWKQYPPDTETVYSYFEARGGAFPRTTFFGLQYFLKKYLQWPVSYRDIMDADALAAMHFGRDDLFHLAGWLHVLEDHGGYLPLRICALPEGTRAPVGTPLITVENTCPKCFWLTNYVETLLVQTWYPTTVATLSGACRALIGRYLEQTGDPSGLDFKLHDFGFRGVSSVESAGLGGCAHLVNFKGTDTLAALAIARDYYGEPCAGFSIPASEHSTITSWGRAHERDAYANFLDQYPEGLAACVSDSFNIWQACEQYWGSDLKTRVLARNGTLVVRPDSGEPAVVVPKVIEALAYAFGYEKNAKGYKVLDKHVRVIQGDGVTPDEIDKILWRLKEGGWSADNIAFGMGGGLLQKLDRDTCKFAFKCSAIKRAGHWCPVSKDPITDQGKKSKAGRLCVYPGFQVANCSADDLPDDFYTSNLLGEVFLDGHLTRETTLKDVRQRAA